MHKKYPVVIHAVLLLFCLLFLFGMFVERTDTGGVIETAAVYSRPARKSTTRKWWRKTTRMRLWV